MNRDCIKFEWGSSSGCLTPSDIKEVSTSVVSELVAYLILLIVTWHFTHFALRWFIHLFPQPKEKLVEFDEATAFIEHCKSWFRNN